jgi:hypothetical protein
VTTGRPVDVGERRRRYMLSALLDDLRRWQSTEELMACGARLFEELADYGHAEGLAREIHVASP